LSAPSLDIRVFPEEVLANILHAVEFRVPSAQVLEQIIVFIRARYKHVRIYEENGPTNKPLLG
jgi:hypothetical protein